MLVLANPRALYGQEKTWWQIGKFDQSSEEFGVSFGFGSLSSGPPDPVCHVGASTLSLKTAPG